MPKQKIQARAPQRVRLTGPAGCAGTTPTRATFLTKKHPSGSAACASLRSCRTPTNDALSGC